MNGQQHLSFAGHIYVMTTWIQNVITDFVILKNLGLTELNFTESEAEFGNKRTEYWQKSFPDVLREFQQLFPIYYEDNKEFFEFVRHFRDFLAHARYSLKLDVVRYQADKGRKDIEEKIKVLTRNNYIDGHTFVKVHFTKENYEFIFNELMKFHREIAPKICSDLNIKYGRLQ